MLSGSIRRLTDSRKPAVVLVLREPLPVRGKPLDLKVVLSEASLRLLLEGASSLLSDPLAGSVELDEVKAQIRVVERGGSS